MGTVVGCGLKFVGSEGAAGFSKELRISGISVVLVIVIAFVMLLKYSWKPGISTRVCCMLAAIVFGSKHNGRRSIVQVTKGGEGVLIAVIVVSIVIDIIGFCIGSFCIGNKELSSASSVSLTIHCISVGAWGVGAMTEGLRIIVFPVVAVFKVVSIIVAIVIVFGCIV